jgi:murein peptide amidase A
MHALARPINRLDRRTADRAAVRRHVAPEPVFVPKLVCRPSHGDLTFKIGIFAGLHGDEEAGTHAAYELLRWAWNEPEELRDYELHIYPVCNPTGRRARTRHSLNGLDLNREFWRGSDQPEIVYLEKELRRESYDGIISLHSDDTSDGLYGFVSGAILSEHVLEPALREAGQLLPCNESSVIDGFHAEHGIIKEGYQGVLSAPPEQNPKPLDIVFETPGLAPMPAQIQATVIAVQTILAEYLVLHSYAPNL